MTVTLHVTVYLGSSHNKFLCLGQKKKLELGSHSHYSLFYIGCSFISSVPSTVNLSCVNLFNDVSGAVNVTVSWSLNGGDSADFYLITITTNAPHTPYDKILNITNANVRQHELTGFVAGYEYNITVRGVNCGGLEGSESEPLTITPQCKYLNR